MSAVLADDVVQAIATATAPPRVFVLLPVHNRRAITERFVACLARQTWPTLHLVLIDDGSTDGTAEAVIDLIPTATVLTGRGDWWWGGGLDQGLAWLERANPLPDDVVLFINDDLSIEPDFVSRGVAEMERRPDALILARFHDPAGGPPIETGTVADLEHFEFSGARSPDEINCLTTQGLFGRWSTVRRIGRFRPVLLPHYLSDFEYTIRAHRLGIPLLTSGELVVDLNRETTGLHAISEPRLWPFVRKYFSKRHASNPVYFTTCIWLVCPPSRRLPNTFRVWRDGALLLLRRVRQQVRG